MPSRRDASPMPEVLSSSSPSPLAEVYKTEGFKNEWANDVRFHVARNLLYLRRYRGLSQSGLGKSSGTSQSAIARIESAQENITLDTLQRLIIALRGRLQISIPPQEHAVQQVCPWWESVESGDGRWSIVGVSVRQVSGFDQALVGMVRSNRDSVSGTAFNLPLISDSSTDGALIDGN